MDKQAQDYAALNFSGVTVLFPQHDVLSVEVTHNLDTHSETPGSVGTLSVMQQDWPVFALTADFNILTRLPGSYRFCLGIRSGDMPFALACESVTPQTLADTNAMTELADCMKLPDNPFQALLVRDDKLNMVCSARGMTAFLNARLAAQ